MHTPTLYHGPNAESVCYDEALLFGSLLRKPFGMEGEGLKKEEAQEVARLNRAGAVKPCSIIVGRLDQAKPISSDALLKVIEEPFDKVRLFLWADDLGGVSPTIKSRCRPVWCGAEEGSEDSCEFDKVELFQRWADNDLSFFIGALMDNKGKERQIVEAFIEGCMNSIGSDAEKAEDLPWARLRELLKLKKLTPSQVVEGLFGGTL